MDLRILPRAVQYGLFFALMAITLAMTGLTGQILSRAVPLLLWPQSSIEHSLGQLRLWQVFFLLLGLMYALCSALRVALALRQPSLYRAWKFKQRLIS